ncbi:hypothetical protein NQV17_13225, partial [Burkholderia sp. SCN-KJ]|nr:hypothetical protein [Burkholderia sp. SCN-KJ]
VISIIHVMSNNEADQTDGPNRQKLTPDEMLAWLGVHASHYLSSQRNLVNYVRGRNVVDAIRARSTTAHSPPPSRAD